ncbi:hypothetical protein L873DRAFT_1803816 [Choiromyces venosus 120613-1]|uniref:Uncharacterized protein n=1 Tax=Choiromyces venosus 120613-1 TaxID=1336337 RepID=A0A3N4JYU8_9PEZI|nr:hypothetical protein L873DRAFT_1803816 [Choiromyces venosus 120613-1]
MTAPRVPSQPSTVIFQKHTIRKSNQTRDINHALTTQPNPTHHPTQPQPSTSTSMPHPKSKQRCEWRGACCARTGSVCWCMQ